MYSYSIYYYYQHIFGRRIVLLSAPCTTRSTAPARQIHLLWVVVFEKVIIEYQILELQVGTRPEGRNMDAITIVDVVRSSVS